MYAAHCSRVDKLLLISCAISGLKIFISDFDDVNIAPLDFPNSHTVQHVIYTLFLIMLRRIEGGIELGGSDGFAPCHQSPELIVWTVPQPAIRSPREDLVRPLNCD